jgi:hypothetical protein
MLVYEVKNWALFLLADTLQLSRFNEAGEILPATLLLVKAYRDEKPTSVLLTSARQTNFATAPVYDAEASLLLLAICPKGLGRS